MIHKDTNKRIIIIALIVVIVLVGGFIVGWLLSPAGQVWAHDWIDTPNGLTATATVALTITTFLLTIATLATVLIALYGIRDERKRAQEDRVEAQKRFEDEQARARDELRDERERFDKAQLESQRQFVESQRQTHEALEEGRRQSLEARYAAHRPLLIPGLWAPGQFNGNPPIRINWNDHEQPSVQIINEGVGIATNVWGVLMYPDALSVPRYPYLSQISSPIPCKENRALNPMISETLLSCSDRVIEKDYMANSCTLGIPKDLDLEGNSGRGDRRDRFIARLTLTYHDIFSRKHASIFDYTDMGSWVCIAFISNIACDIVELEEAKGGTRKETPPPTVTVFPSIWN